MTIEEVCQEIEAETHTRSWKEMTVAMRLLVLQGCIDEWTGFLLESVEAGPGAVAAKKVVKQRKPRKAKTVPLTQHAVSGEEQRN